jgi:O-antigen/teichoic acid export membrane protein
VQAPPPPPLSRDPSEAATLLDQAARGYRATLVSQAIRVGCKALSVIVLARLVPPEEHGLFAMAASVFHLLVIFRDLGLGAAAIQAPELSEEQRTALWYAHAALGMVLAAAGAVLAPVAAAFYHEPRAAGVLVALSLSFVLLGLNLWPRVLLSRELRFSELTRLESLAAVIGTAAMIAAGALGAGAYAFVAFVLVSETVALIGAWRICRWRPRGRPRWRSLAGFWRIGADITGYNLLLAIWQQVDGAAMGRWFGAAALGLYHRPAQLLALPAQHVAAPLASVMLAALARLGRDSPDFRRHVRATSGLIAHLTLPLAAVCFALPDETIRLLLGRDWPEAAPLLRWLAIGAAATYLGAVVYSVAVAAARTRQLAGMTAVSLLATLVAVWLGRGFGPEGIAAGVALANVILLGPRLWWAARGTPLRLRDYADAFATPVTFALALAGGMIAGRSLAAEGDWLTRLAAGLAGGAALGALLLLAWPRLQGELAAAWRHRGSIASGK